MNAAHTDGKFTLDAGKFAGNLDLGAVSASGAVAVSMGTAGDFSADGSYNRFLHNRWVCSCNHRASHLTNC